MFMSALAACAAARSPALCNLTLPETKPVVSTGFFRFLRKMRRMLPRPGALAPAQCCVRRKVWAHSQSLPLQRGGGLTRSGKPERMLSARCGFSPGRASRFARAILSVSCADSSPCCGKASQGIGINSNCATPTSCPLRGCAAPTCCPLRGKWRAVRAKGGAGLRRSKIGERCSNQLLSKTSPHQSRLRRDSFPSGEAKVDAV